MSCAIYSEIYFDTLQMTYIVTRTCISERTRLLGACLEHNLFFCESKRVYSHIGPEQVIPQRFFRPNGRFSRPGASFTASAI